MLLPADMPRGHSPRRMVLLANRGRSLGDLRKVLTGHPVLAREESRRDGIAQDIGDNLHVPALGGGAGVRLGKAAS